MFDSLSPDSTSSKPSQSKRIKHPAFEESDSEDENESVMSKAMLFQLAFRQETQGQETDSSPLLSTVSHESPHAKLLNAFESPFKRLPKHFLHFHHDSKPQFLIVNETSPPTEKPPSRSVPTLTPPDAVAPALKVQPSLSSRPAPVQPLRLRPRRYSAPEPLRDNQSTILSSKETPMLRRYLSLNLGTSSGAREQSPRQEQKPKTSIPLSDPIISPWSEESSSTRVVFVDQPNYTYTPEPDLGDFPTTPLSAVVIPDFPEPPLGLTRFEKPKLMLRTADLSPDPEAQWTPQKLEGATQERRHKLRKYPAVTREIKISAPASLDNSISFLDLEVAPPRTPPIPPSSSLSPSFTFINNHLPNEAPVLVEEQHTGGGTSSNPSRHNSNEASRKLPKLITVAKVAGKLLRHHSPPTSSSAPINPAPAPSLPPLLYSTSTPIQQHILAISVRIKDEFKMKLNKETELPNVDAATEEELVQQLGDVNEDIGQCAKKVVKILSRSTADKRESKSIKTKKTLDLQGTVRTALNSFLVSRVFQPFSIQLSPEDDEAVRERYTQIAPSVPQFVASRWRVVASASTSRPIQELGQVLESLATEVSIEILGERSSEADLTKEITTLLVPLIRHAYLLAHFNHLEMVTSDYDIFAGTELGGWIIPGQEDEKLHSRHSISKSQDTRISGYWTLGLRKKRYVGEGALQRRVWDVLLKSQVLTSRTL